MEVDFLVEAYRVSQYPGSLGIYKWDHLHVPIQDMSSCESAQPRNNHQAATFAQTCLYRG
uniref:Uncharacterized protein n=1 Tax=Rhizophora mucronata TaxID=61149 RepID=A0A2P2MPI9_RHIMU